MQRKLMWLVGQMLVWSLVLSACKGEIVTATPGIVGYNHTDTSIAHFLLNGGSGGGFTQAHHGGGGTTCCVSIPAWWRPGLQVEVTWTTDQKNYQRQMVSIPEYERGAGRMAVHFLRNGEVKVFVTSLGLGHPDYPLKGPEASLVEGEDPVRPHLRRQPKKETL
jgi:hypothetical protein